MWKIDDVEARVQIDSRVLWITDDNREGVAVVLGYNTGYTRQAMQNARLIASAPAMFEALRKIAYDPFGPSEATHAEVLEAITQLARAVIENVKPPTHSAAQLDEWADNAAELTLLESEDEAQS